MRAAAEAGRWPWRPPVGYARTDEPGILAHDPLRAPMVVESFRRVAGGLGSANSVRRDLNALGLLSFSGRPMSCETFYRMLRHQLYRGRVVVERWGVSVPTAFEPLIDAETFERAQAVLEGRAYSPDRVTDGDDTFPLRRFLYCGACSTSITGSTSRGRSATYDYYRCPKCARSSVRAEELHDRFTRRLEGISFDERLVPMFREAVTRLSRAE